MNQRSGFNQCSKNTFITSIKSFFTRFLSEKAISIESCLWTDWSRQMALIYVYLQ